MKKKVVVLGATGMLGHQVVYRLGSNSDIELIDVVYRNKLRDESIVIDLSNKEKLETFLLKEKPDYIINCVGILIQGANNNISNGIYINSFLPHFLAELCDSFHGKLIHVSTDCVFSGDKGGYVEGDFKDGKDYYAKSKSLGEVDNANHLTLRTSIIGPELKEGGEGLLHWFLKEKDTVNGFLEAYWSGVTTFELAKFIEFVLFSDLSGLYHVTNNTKINKFDLLNIFNKYTNKPKKILPVNGKKVDKSFVDTRKESDYIVPSYDDMVKEMFSDLSLNLTRYKYY